MENQEDGEQPHDHRHRAVNRSGVRSMSDADSQASHADEFLSPLHFTSPIHDDATKSPANSPSKSIVAVDKFYPPPPPTRDREGVTPSPVVVYNRSERREAAAAVVVGGERKSGTRRYLKVETAALGFRVCEVVFSLIAFSVMASDRTKGWSGDSFDRYKEYRYCIAVNIIAFVYSGFQAVNLAYHSIGERDLISYRLHYHFVFLMDQVLAYLLISASSSAATRVDDWISNWGKDDFTEMASASVGMSFLAFLAFALSSLVSGYILCTRTSVR